MTGRLSTATTPDPIVKAVVAARLTARGAVGVRGLAAELHVSERQLRRRCQQALGYGPKTLHRILRFQLFLDDSARVPRSYLATAATSAGYADQAHLARECQRLDGLGPAGLLLGERCDRFVQAQRRPERNDATDASALHGATR